MIQCREFAILSLLLGLSVGDNITLTKFPPGFKIGAATSSYQVEGGVYDGGQGVSIWDNFVHRKPSPIKDGSTGDVAADSYHRYKEDVQLLKYIGFDHYRFSISWTRILPNGEIDYINQEGINYYNKLIDELLANNIEPLVTMFHWELPQRLQDLGGWTNPLIVDYFEDYTYILYKHFGDRVKRWITINEPTILLMGYNDKTLAPGLSIRGTGEYVVGHNIIKAHAKAYRLYEREFKAKQKGQVGITIVGENFTPLIKTKENMRAVERAFQFVIGWFAHPIFSKEGDYPSVMRRIIDRNSAGEHRRRSRLPSFTPEEIEEIKGSSDFLGLNYYSSSIISEKTNYSETESYHHRDMKANLLPDPSWNASAEVPQFYVVPTGLRGVLNFIKNRYGNPPVFITENGYGDSSTLEDHTRINFFQSHLSEMLKAYYIDKCNVIGYTAWSLIDTFEWNSGYTVKFGLGCIDFEDPERKRIPKKSAFYFKQLLKSRELPDLNSSFPKYDAPIN